VTNAAPMSSAVSWCDKNGMRTAFMGSGLPMKADFAEANPLMARLVGGVEYALDLVTAVLRREQAALGCIGQADQASATHHPLPDDSVSPTRRTTTPSRMRRCRTSAMSGSSVQWATCILGCFGRR